jgi:hypothetical protein
MCPSPRRHTPRWMPIIRVGAQAAQAWEAADVILSTRGRTAHLHRPVCRILLLALPLPHLITSHDHSSSLIRVLAKLQGWHGGRGRRLRVGDCRRERLFLLFSLPALLDELLFIIQRLANSASRSSRVGGYWSEVIWCGRPPSGEGMGSEIDCLSRWKRPFLRA